MRDPDWAFKVSEYPPITWIYDFQNRRMVLVQLDAGPDSMILEEFSLNVGVSLLNPVWVGGRMISNALLPDAALMVIDRQGRAVAQVQAPQPFTEREMPLAVGRLLLNRTYLALDPSRRRVALVYQFAPRIDFYTAGGLRYGSVIGPRATVPSFRAENDRFFWNDENEMAYAGAAATYNYVYALFCGCRLGYDDQGPHRLHVFSWNGAFVAEIAVDRPIDAFAVSDDDTELVAAFQTAAGHPLVGVWSLPRSLRMTSAIRMNRSPP
jgi:hypothetical protein